MPYSIKGAEMQIASSQAGRMENFKRTRSASELTRQQTMQVGMYRLQAVLSKDNDAATLKKTIGDNYQEVLQKPLADEKFPVLLAAGRYVFALPERYDSPRFDGKTFTSDNKLFGSLKGHRVNDKKIEGTLTMGDTGIRGTFTIERIGPLNMDDGVDISMPGGSHFKTGNAFEAGQTAKPTGSTKVKVDLSTPEKTAQELIRASKERDINRFWACTSAAFRTDLMKQIGGTEKEDQLRNEMYDEGGPEVTAVEIVSTQMADDTHCVIQIKWTAKGKDPQPGRPLHLVKEKGEWRMLKLY